MSLAPFATASDLAVRLGRTLSSTEQAQADAFCDDASGMIRDFCRQDINAQTGLAVTFESPDGPWLDLPQRPVTGVTSVAINGQVVTDFKKVGDRLYRVYGWAWPSIDVVPPLAIYTPVSTVTVTYDAGYNPIPQVIVSVCINAAMRAFDNPTGVLRESIDDYTRDFSRGFSGDAPTGTGVFLDAADQKRLRRYARRSFAVNIGTRR